MAIDFTFPEHIETLRSRVAEFMNDVVRPLEAQADAENWERARWIEAIISGRAAAKQADLWLPHMPTEWGGLGLGHLEMAAVSAEAGKTRMGPFMLNAQAPDEGNMHTLLHWGTPDQHARYLQPLCDGYARSCFAMTEPEVAGSDPTLIRTAAYQDGEEWVINVHKWFTS